MNWLTLICSFGIPSILLGLVVKCIAACVALKRGVQVMLRCQLVQLYDRWITEEAIPYSIKQLFEDMYSQYEKLGPNGVMDQMHEDFKNRPTDTKTMK